jgi:hypothetical protein
MEREFDRELLILEPRLPIRGRLRRRRRPLPKYILATKPLYV